MPIIISNLSAILHGMAFSLYEWWPFTLVIRVIDPHSLPTWVDKHVDG